jgi:hypothetical protein
MVIERESFLISAKQGFSYRTKSPWRRFRAARHFLDNPKKSLSNQQEIIIICCIRNALSTTCFFSHPGSEGETANDFHVVMWMNKALVCWFCSYTRFDTSTISKGRLLDKGQKIALDMATKKKGKSKYYAVARGRRTGIFPSWEACKEQVRRG